MHVVDDHVVLVGAHAAQVVVPRGVDGDAEGVHALRLGFLQGTRGVLDAVFLVVAVGVQWVVGREEEITEPKRHGIAAQRARTSLSERLEVERFVYVSSSMVFERAELYPTPERYIHDCPVPLSAYGFSKLTGEVYCRAAHEEHGDHGARCLLALFVGGAAGFYRWGPQRVHELDSSREIVAHCRSGVRSAKAVDFLRQAGFKKVHNLAGGILAWADRVDPKMPKY